MEGIIVKSISNNWTVDVKGKKIVCQARGKLKYDKITPLVGDKVIISEEHFIEKVLPRKNELERPIVANIDSALIMTSVKEPDLSLNLLDKLLSIVAINKIEPIICFTKTDLLEECELNKFNTIKKYYESVGYKVFINSDIDDILSYLKGKIVVLTGQTGVGKSTFLNKIDQTLNLDTNPISKALNRGVHTTRHVELYELNNVFFVDTPGFSSIDLKKYSIEQVKNSFKEFKDIDCLYKDCNHDKEEECLVKKNVENNKILSSRYDNYLLFIKEIYESSSKLYKKSSR